MTDVSVAQPESSGSAGGDETGGAAGAWWSHHLVALAGGLGVGLLVYRYAVLPFVVTTVAAKLYLWIGVGALAGARQAFRAGVGDVTSGVLGRARLGVGFVAAAIGFGVAGLISPPFGYLWLGAHSFPGFDLKLPLVGEVAPEPSTYAQGRITVRRPGGLSGVVQVSWDAGGLPDEEDVAAIGRAYAAGLQENVADARMELQTTVGAQAGGKTWVLHAGARESLMTFVPCGARRIMIATMGEPIGWQRLHARVLRTLHCQADAARDASLGDVPVVFDLGKGWFRLPSTPDQLQLTDRRVLLVARPIPRTDEMDKVAELLNASMSGMHAGARDGDHWPLEMEIDGEKQEGWLQARDCPALGQTLLLMSTGEKDASAQTLAVLRGARCRRAGEAPQRWPALPR